MKPDESRTVFEGRLIRVTLERWGDDEREIVEHPGSVAIVAVDTAGEVTLVRQFRHPARIPILELPAGKLEAGEDPLASAQRELAEEVGLHGGSWRLLARCWTSPGFLREEMHLFAAEGVEAGNASPDADEQIEVVRWRVAELERRIGELEDAKTIAGLLLYLRG
jgi:ADP-ribose pyrophosphatase